MTAECEGSGVLRDMTAGKVRCVCGLLLWAVPGSPGPTLGWTPAHPLPACGALCPIGAEPCAEPPDHPSPCRDASRTKAWPAPRCTAVKREGKRTWRCAYPRHAPERGHLSPSGGRRW